jgi:nucleotide-binding universal stress UspA family protein
MKILLAIDDSTYSREATRTLMTQFRSQNADVRVLSVVEAIAAYVSADAFPHFVPQIEEIEKDREKQAAHLVKQVAKNLRKAGFKTSEVVDLGDPKTQIIDNATKWGADLIVIGSHGWKGLNRFLLGSVSEAVARHAPCSVEIVKIRAASKTAAKRK